MEVGDSGVRQSSQTLVVNTGDSSSTNNGREPQLSRQPSFHLQSRAPPGHEYRHSPAMAAATVANPPAPYHSQPAGYPSTYSQGGSSSGPSTVMPSPNEAWKQADESESSRQSLPSISEVISGAKPSTFPPPHHNIHAGPPLPSPFAPRSFTEPDKPSPQPLHHSASFPSRQEPLPPFTDSPRPAAFSGRPSLPSVSDRRPSPTSRPDGTPQHHPQDLPRSEPYPRNGAFPQHQPPPSGHQPMQYQPGPPPLPPGQLPLPAYPASPRHQGLPPGQVQFEPRGLPPGVHPDEVEYGRARYDATVNRHFENWSYQDGLARVVSSSRTIFNFAEAYSRRVHDQHTPHPIPDRLPTEAEVGDMLANCELVKRSLEQIRELVQISIQNERAREGANAQNGYDDEQDAMYANGMKTQYGMAEVKKRRGRAAPPGRCHSCNRIDTPEWRRGPDGARTLCNACGLHYAKLERKRQLEARSIRPKPEERS